MKTLQNNFTTPEQSKRLLELGVPADSADCYINEACENRAFQLPDIFSKCTWVLKKRPIPCWSVGRLIEIMTICYKWDLLSCASFRIYMTDIISHNLINQLINDLSLEIRRDKIDFSKLEE